MNPTAQHWQDRLSALAEKHGIVGASLAIAHGDQEFSAATGVLNLRTAQPVTPDSLFQIGSITKVWTATLAMQLVDDGLLDLDAPVVRYLPAFRIADAEISASVTTRQLLTHTSGIDGDLFIDTGRGDDALEKYVAEMAQLTRAVPPQALMSYCNSGYNLLGHLIALLRGKPWEQVLQERLLKPLGLDSAGTLPEEALLYGTAAGHLQPPGAAQASVTPQWGLYRSAGPAGLIHSTAAHQLAFARLHLNDGIAADGTRLLSAASARAMRIAQIEIPDRWLLGSHMGLGWMLNRWGDEAVYGHDGATLGQNAFLRVLPGATLAICLLVNGGRAVRALYHELFSEIAMALAGVAPPPLPRARRGLSIDPARFVGRYLREGLEVVIQQSAEGLTLTQTPKALLGIVTPTTTLPLAAYDDDILLALPPGQDYGTPVVFFDLGGKRYMHFAARTAARADD
ncbi:MAG TPA: serine hydrolase domain-containing protein [Fontimonas sp.]